MKTSLHLLLLVTILVHMGTSFPMERRGSQGGREKYSTWDDVNVVAHGLLQLGQGLKDHVEKTKVQMRDINAKLKAFNGTAAELQRGQQEQVEALTATGEVVEERVRLAMELAGEARVKVEEMKAESRSIQSRMDRLEEKVDGALREQVAVESNYSDHSGVSLVQRLMEAQNRRIDDLVDKIKQQQDKLEKQSLHLQTLQSKVAQRRGKSHRRRDEETLGGQRQQSNALIGLARDCHDLFVQGQRASGVYTIQPENSVPFNVLCEMTSEGGWTVIQKRSDGSQNFNQLWERYQRGFGSLNGEFWLGLENIHSISKQGPYTLQVEVSDWTGQEQTARFQFRLDGEETKYALHLQQASSEVLEKTMTTGASGLPFSTSDNDNDLNADVNCAELLSGGWWFSSCGESNLNGKYPRGPRELRRQQTRRQGMFWTTTEGRINSLESTTLKIRPAAIKQ